MQTLVLYLGYCAKKLCKVSNPSVTKTAIVTFPSPVQHRGFSCPLMTRTRSLQCRIKI